jgi:hypothetical protein
VVNNPQILQEAGNWTPPTKKGYLQPDDKFQDKER